MNKKHRFNFTLFAFIIIFLSACATAPVPAAVPTDYYQIIVPADDIEAGTPRVPFILYDGENRAADITAVSITVYDLSDSTNPVEVWSGPAVSYADYAVPYWVVQPEIPEAGFWGIEAQITNAAQDLSTAQFAIQTLADPEGPNIGETPPASQNRTVTTVGDISELSSAIAPKVELHQLTVAEILETSRPAVIAFNTPAFCQTAFCAPVLGSIEGSYEQYNGRVDYLHLEIFKEFDPLVTADEVTEWKLTSEPWTFVLDKEGVIIARLAGPVSPRELAFYINQTLE